MIKVDCTMAAPLEFTLNGRLVRGEDCSPDTPLFECLRGTGLAGSRAGGAEEDCGACSVAGSFCGLDCRPIPL